MELELVLPDESPSMPVGVLVELARAAEGLGYAGLWLPDHVLPPGEYGATFGGVYEPLVTIGHLAAVTDRVRLGTSVLIAPLRDPFVLAKQVATLQHLSEGRVVLGLGVGWSEPEFAAVGAEFRTRGAVTDDTLALLAHLFGGGSAPYAARRFAYEQGVFAPVPTDGVPIMIGGNSDAALRRAARHGAVWQGLPTSSEAYEERRRALAALPGGGDVVPAARIAWDGTRPLARVAEEVAAYREAGVQRLAVHVGDHDGALTRMTDLITEVG